MEGALIISPPRGEATHIPFNHPGERPSLHQMQQIVGGPIELIPMLDRVDLGRGEQLRVQAYCNEEGKIQGLPINAEATHIWQRAMESRGMTLDDVLVGTVIFLVGTEEFLRGDQS